MRVHCGFDLMFDVEQAVLSLFEQGDKIGWSTQHEDRWLGTIVDSESDPAGWHLSWYRDDDPAMLYHFRGPRTVRDSRWLYRDTFVIHELP